MTSEEAFQHPGTFRKKRMLKKETTLKLLPITLRPSYSVLSVTTVEKED